MLGTLSSETRPTMLALVALPSVGQLPLQPLLVVQLSALNGDCHKEGQDKITNYHHYPNFLFFFTFAFFEQGLRPCYLYSFENFPKRYCSNR